MCFDITSAAKEKRVKREWFGQKGRRSIDKVKDFGTLIGAESHFTGTLAGKDNYAIYGTVEGDCDLSGALLLGPGARWKGNISASVVFIAGEVEGNVTAHEKLEVARGAKVKGNLSSAAIALAEGALFEGEVKMSAAAGEAVHYTERRRVPPADEPATE